jgi:hypothetical protein
MKGRNILHKSWIIALMLCLVSAQAFAVSIQGITPGTPIVFADTGGTVVWTLSAKAAGTGQVSAQFDKGAGSQPAWWEMRCQISLNGTHTLGATVEYYVATSDGTAVDAGVGTANATITSDQRRALTLMAGVLSVYQTTTLTTMFVSFRNLYIPNRYFSLVMWNNTAIPTETSTTKHKCSMTPMPWSMS